jgi:hypothetical protein
MLDPNRAFLLKSLRGGMMTTLQGLPAKSILDVASIMEDFEECHQALTIWLWLSFRLNRKGQFAGQSIAAAEIAEVQEALNKLLELLTGTKLPYNVDGDKAKKVKREQDKPEGGKRGSLMAAAVAQV